MRSGRGVARSVAEIGPTNPRMDRLTASIMMDTEKGRRLGIYLEREGTPAAASDRPRGHVPAP
jgi:hypothetical protein